MIWFFLALIGPFAWALVNHADKYLLSSRTIGGKPGALIILSTLVGLVVSGIIYLAYPSVVDIPWVTAGKLIIVGILVSVNILLYLFAMQKGEASVIVPFYQLVPVFGFILGYFILGEVVSNKELLAGVIIIAGAFIMSFEIDVDEGYKFRHDITWYMLCAVGLLSFSEVLFKSETVVSDFWRSVFWQHIGLGAFCLVLVLFVPRWRNDFVDLVRSNSRAVFGLNSMSEAMTIFGNLTFSYATLLAPIALVMLVASYQPVFVFVIGVLLTKFFPHISTEKVSRKHLFHRVGAITVILVGTTLLYT